MKTLLVAFGDSWTFGSELDIPREYPWVIHLAERIGAVPVNLGVPASGIGHLTVQLFNFVKKNSYPEYKKVFMIGLSGFTRYLTYSNQHNEFITITPEAVYRTAEVHETGRAPPVLNEFNIISSETYKRVQHTDYDTFLAIQQIALIQNFCQARNIKCYFFSYFDEFNFYGYENVIDLTLVHPETITRSLTGKEYSHGVMDHEYFAGKLFHPNVAGHKQIANILYDQYISRN